MKADAPHLLFKIHYRQAELENARGQNQESLVYLKQAITQAEEANAAEDDPLSCMAAETYLNAAIAL